MLRVRLAVSLSFCVYIIALLAARNSVAVDGSFRSLSYVVALLAACHSVAVANCSCPSLSGLLRSRSSRCLSFCCCRLLRSFSLLLHIVAELAVVKARIHYITEK